jgi:hypothetical protein
MVSSAVEWAAAVLGVGVVAGLVVLAAGSVGVWWLYRRVRRRVEAFTGTAAGYALQTAAAAVGRGKLPPQVVHELRRRLGGRPEVW